MKRLVILSFLISILLTGCKKVIFKRYTFEGILYHDDKKEPITDIPLQLILSNGSCEFGCNTYEVLKHTTTDDKGYFKINYAHQLKVGTIKLEMEGNEDYSSEHIASGIEKNQDVNMDFFRNARADVKIRFNIHKENTKHDTLFCVYAPLDWSKKEISYTYNDSIYKIDCRFKLIDSKKQFVTNSFKVQFDQNFDFTGLKRKFYYGIGINNFRSILANNGEYQVSKEYLTPLMYPDTTIIDVDVN